MITYNIKTLSFSLSLSPHFTQCFKARQARVCFNIDLYRFIPPGPHLFNDGSLAMSVLHSCRAGGVAIMSVLCGNFVYYQRYVT